MHVLDLFQVTGEAPAAFNPLASLDPDDIDAGEGAASLHDPPEQVSEAH
ncbi:hypothetical protein [Phenylobacterium sp.]